MVKTKEDMTGWVMSEHGVSDSRLTVIQQAEDYIRPDGRPEAQWLCECNCGSDKTVVVLGYRLRSGKTLSCGCLTSEIARRKRKETHKVNEYDYSHEYGVGFTSNTGREFYFDWDDFDKIKDYCWSESIDQKKDYHWLNAYDMNTKKFIKMHQLIVGRYCDHIDRNPLNNRKENLRLSTFSTNAQNRGVFKNNTSTVTGVSYRTRYSKWASYISVQGHRIYLGNFNNKDDAIRARLKAEKQYFGEFSPQKHLFEQYQI